MGIESAITTHLNSDATLSGLSVGVYPHVAPADASYPFIVYSVTSSETEHYINKDQNPSPTLTNALVDLSIYSESVSERAQIMSRLKTMLHDFRGALGTESLDIRSAALQTVATFSESDLTGTDEQIFRSQMPFNFTYNWV